MTRDVVLFWSGIIGVWFIATHPQYNNTEVLLVFAAWAGSPIVFRVAEMRQKTPPKGDS